MKKGHLDRPESLDEALSQLPRSIEPGRDLWPGIAARLEQGVSAPRSRHRWTWAAAAAVLLVIGSSLITATLLRQDPQPVADSRPAAADEPTIVPEVIPATAGDFNAGFGPGHRVGPAYLANRRVLARELEERLARLPPEGREQLAKNIAELRRASAEINAALELHPGDPLLEELLFNIYQDEISVLANVDRLTAADPTTAPTRIPL
jgi:hypothetical protein